MGRKNFDYFIDRGYFESQLAALKADIIAHIDNRMAELLTQTKPPAASALKRKTEPAGNGEPDPCMIWKMEMRKRCEKLCKDYPKYNTNLNSVLGKIYRIMDGQYGVCLAQEVKERKRGRDNKVSTLDAISVKESLRSLFESILFNMEEGCRLKEEKAHAVEEAMLARTRQEIIQPLIEARADKSTNGCATYSAVWHEMKKKGVDFDAAEKRYRGKEGIKRAIKIKELVDNDIDTKRKFAETVAELLHEAGKAADHERAS